MVDLEYDLKAFQQVLLGTRTFQFAANPKAFEVGVPQAFNGRQLARMSSEQLWDTLVTLIADEPDKLAKRKHSDHIFYNGKPVLVGQKTMAELAREVMAIKKPTEYKKYAENLIRQFEDTSSGICIKGYDDDGTQGTSRASGRNCPRIRASSSGACRSLLARIRPIRSKPCELSPPVMPTWHRFLRS